MDTRQHLIGVLGGNALVLSSLFSFSHTNGKLSSLAHCTRTHNKHRFVQYNDKRLLRLKPFSHSQVVWFRNPYVHIVLVRKGVC